MPLLDPFHPPMSRTRDWDSFHGAWAEAIARHLNEELLPDRYFAEARVKIGRDFEIDVGTFSETATPPATGGVAVWTPPKPATRVALPFGVLDTIEVQISRDVEGPEVVAAIELVSPANKDRASHRHAFAVKGASYLQAGLGLVVIDVVTARRANLHQGLLEVLQTSTDGTGDDLFAASYRIVTGDAPSLELWYESLQVGGTLPTMPLWLSPELCVPLDLETTYAAACTGRRIAMPEG